MDELVNPYNENNINITKENIQEILSKYKVYYDVKNIKIWERAFVNSSYCRNNNLKYVQKPSKCIELKSKSNERLEFIGDGILEYIVKTYLYERFPDADEGFMTEKKISLVKNEHIGQLAYKLGLNKWLLLSKNAEEKKNRVNYKKLGCLFEAFIGALYLDGNDRDGNGINYCRIFVENIFNDVVNWVEILENDDNYKNIFQEIIQKEFKCTPEYVMINLDDELRYTMGVYLCLGDKKIEPSDKNIIPSTKLKSFNDIKELNTPAIIYFGSGKHKIKKKAEQIACLEAIQSINNYS